ncbi:MAG: sel1 repeat family protein [Deltaproteobacteria bacterium]|nr:sel1 repeat family protein [Deltaproteobacteria bacterium]
MTGDKTLEDEKLGAGKEEAMDQFLLAQLHHQGQLVERDLAKAYKYYKLAADQGLAQAQFCLARLCQDGEGAEKDLAQAAKYWRLAADQGDGGAGLDLGLAFVWAKASKWIWPRPPNIGAWPRTKLNPWPFLFVRGLLSRGGP